MALAICLTGIGTGRAADSTGDLQSRGQDIIGKFVEANRYWLVAPPTTVTNLTYVLNRLGGTQEVLVTDPAAAPRARLQGVTHATLVHQLAYEPKSATVTEISDEGDKVRLALKFEPAIRCAIGNGVEQSWNGYHSFSGSEGYVVLEKERWVPVEAHIGSLTETFGEYATVENGLYVPLTIREEIGDTRYDWRFRLYAPGLWLYDEGFSDGRRLAWVEEVKVNSADAKLVQATKESLQLAERAKVGQERLRAFLDANRHWLLPSLAARRGLVCEYRQEAPYLERVLFAPDGSIMACLAATKESPDQPTRQRLWLADGRSWSGNASDAFVKLGPARASPADAESWLQRDRIVQHLAMGLALDCALTRLAREPEGFWAEVQPVADQSDRYLLVLHAQRDASLFTGTMLAFSSWCFMHDVRYDRSEILCDAATHRPIEEKDYEGSKELKGDYFFESWLSDASGSAPGRIRAVMPYEKEGKDHALEMDARFRFARPAVWMLERVEGWFHGDGGSTGTVAIVTSNAEAFQPLTDLLQKAARTTEMLGAIQQAPEGAVEQKLATGEWSPLALKAAWADKARQSAEAQDESRHRAPAADSLLIGLHRGRISSAPGGSAQIELEGVSTASWKEFLTQWKVTARDGQGNLLPVLTTNVAVRAESAPTPFVVRLDLPPSASAAQPVSIEGAVQRMSGAYHGHGTWYRFAVTD